MSDIESPLLLATLKRLDDSVNRLNNTVSDLRQRLGTIEAERADEVSDRNDLRSRQTILAGLLGGILAIGADNLLKNLPFFHH